MSKFLSVFVLFLYLLNSFPSATASEVKGGAQLLNANAYSISAEASVFTTAAHYNSAGEEYAMNQDSSFRLIDADFKVSYGISSNLETSLFAKLRSVSSNDGINSATNSGPESIGFEGRYAFVPIDKLIYSVGVRYRKTLYTNTVYSPTQTPLTDEIILGDDGSEYGVDFYASYLMHPWILDLKFGYNSPPNDLSSEIIYKIQALYRLNKLGLFVGLDGIYSLNSDQYTETPSLKPIMTTGQTEQFNTINRGIVAPYLGANYALNKSSVFFKAQTIIKGKSFDKGNTLALGFSWNSDGVSADALKIGKFKEYNIDGSVLKVSARGTFIKIDQGLSTDVEKGMKFDIYQTDYFGGNVLVASGIAHEVGSDWTVIKLIKKYNEIEIKPGFAARGY